VIKRRYKVYDVFADKPLAGNPLAVVLDSDGLDTAAMQRIAREFNLSETVFVGTPEKPAHSAAMRIFTPGIELPFAGHPTVGAAVALAEERGREAAGEGTEILVIEEVVGPVRCAVRRGKGVTFAEFDLPRLPEKVRFEVVPELVAAALDLDAQDIGFENHRVEAWSAGVPYVTVPVRGLAAAAKARMDVDAWMKLAPHAGHLIAAPYIYCRETVGHEASFHARMLAPHEGVPEDPATGSAAAAFAGAVMRFDAPSEGSTRLLIEQGVEMGRPSKIRLELDVEHGALTAARIGGHAVRVAEGTLFA
jgi:trans-2,3-dihydro-3-hydroxyanthranilate isomerase